MIPLLMGVAVMMNLAGGPQEQSAEPRVLVRGIVRDVNGTGIPNASLYLRGSDVFGVSGPDGRFVLTGTAEGDATLVAVHAGFQAFEQRISLSHNPLTLDLVLQIQTQVEWVEVAAVVPNLNPAGTLQLQPLDIYRTPGSDADPMRALQMLPGVVKVDEGAGLFVRGGDVSETATYLDHALLYHPYRYETPTGGFFGTVDPYLISGLSLSSGAFPARYGNALSGLLELTGLDRPEQTAIYANLGLGAASASLGIPLGQHMGLRFSGNQSLSPLLFAVNPGNQRFEKLPSGTDLNLSLYADYANAGKFKFSVFTDREQVGVETQQNAFTGILNSQSNNRLFSLNWRKDLGPWRLVATLSYGAYRENEVVGVLNLASQDSGERMRLDISRSRAGWILRTGMEAERQGAISRGTVPIHGGDFGGIQGTRPWSIDLAEWRVGVYGELERTIGRWTANLGARFDRFQALRVSTAGARASVSYSLPQKQRVRLAWGTYHQAPSPVYLNPEDGNPHLQPMLAQHLVAGYEYGEESGRFYLRVEGYAKYYSRLPLQDATVNFNDRGSGFARGVDLFLKVAPAAGWEGWASYSFLDAMRLYTPFDDFQQYDIPTARYRPDFDIPHTLQLVLQHSLTESISAGASFRVASGKPFTPVVGSYDTPNGLVPIYGPINSERLPLYQRLDFSLSKSFSVARKVSMIVYLGVTNVMNHYNVFAYAYSSDYSRRSPAEGAWGRNFYFGMTFHR